MHYGILCCAVHCGIQCYIVFIIDADNGVCIQNMIFVIFAQKDSLTVVFGIAEAKCTFLVKNNKFHPKFSPVFSLSGAIHFCVCVFQNIDFDCSLGKFSRETFDVIFFSFFFFLRYLTFKPYFQEK